MNKITQIISKIQEVVPEVKKWQDGAKVQLELYSSYTNEGSDIVYSNEPEIFETGIILNDEVLGCDNGNLRDMQLKEKDFKNGIYTYGVDENGGISVEEYEKVEILGRDLTLQDLLLAVHRTKKNLLEGISIDDGGNFMITKKGDTYHNGFSFDLSKSFLENLEDDEFREFLFNLICK